MTEIDKQPTFSLMVNITRIIVSFLFSAILIFAFSPLMIFRNIYQSKTPVVKEKRKNSEAVLSHIYTIRAVLN